MITVLRVRAAGVHADVSFAFHADDEHVDVVEAARRGITELVLLTFGKLADGFKGIENIAG